MHGRTLLAVLVVAAGLSVAAQQKPKPKPSSAPPPETCAAKEARLTAGLDEAQHTVARLEPPLQGEAATSFLSAWKTIQAAYDALKVEKDCQAASAAFTMHTIEAKIAFAEAKSKIGREDRRDLKYASTMALEAHAEALEAARDFPDWEELFRQTAEDAGDLGDRIIDRIVALDHLSE